MFYVVCCCSLLSFVDCCLLCVACFVLFVVCWLLFGVCCLLFAVCWFCVLFAKYVCCSGVYYSLFAVFLWSMMCYSV